MHFFQSIHSLAHPKNNIITVENTEDLLFLLKQLTVMTRRITAFLIVSLLVLSGCSRQEPFVFIQIADPQFGMFEQEDSFPNSARMLQEAVDVIKEVRPAFVVSTGDMTDKVLSEYQYDEYMKIMGGIPSDIPVYHVPGNHEEAAGGNPVSEESMARYRSRYGENHFSFTYGGCGFMGYDSSLIKDGSPELEENQYEWMESTLKELSAKCSQIFVFTHCPIVEDSEFKNVSYFSYEKPYRQKYIDLFNKYNVKALLAGHRHKPSTFTPGNFVQITAGACGCAPLDGSSSGIEVVKVYPDHFVFNFLPVQYVSSFLKSLK